MRSLKSECIDSTETLLSANRTVSSFRSKHVLFLNRQDLLFFPVGLFCFLFFINSTFNLGPGVIACATGVFFFVFFKRAKASVACEQQTNFRSSLRRERSDDRKYVCRLQAKASVKSVWSAFPPRAFLALLACFALAFAGLKNTHTKK